MGDLRDKAVLPLFDLALGLDKGEREG